MSTAASVAQPTTAPAYRMIGRTMIIQSSTNPKQSYTVTDRGCTCKGAQFRGVCRHQTTRAEVLASRQPMSDAAYAKVLEACDELF